jgi:hypothetical protein
MSGCVQGAVVDDGNGGSLYGSGDYYGTFSCTLYSSPSSYTIDLKPYLTDGGTVNLYGGFIVTPVTPGYEVIINGDPNALPDDGTGLLNQNLWQAVLYFNPDINFGSGSDELTMYFAGAFPSVATVINFDQTEYAGGFPDSAFFVEATGNDTVYSPALDSYEVIVATPEPSSLLLFGTGLAMLCAFARRKRFVERLAANRAR